jgi:hypothetical protein
MTRSRLITTAMVALAIPATPVAVLSQTTIANAPITLRYITTGEFKDHGTFYYGTTVWATNHTTEPLMISLSAIEVWTGSNWTTRGLQSQPLVFRPAGKRLTHPLLQSHVAGYATFELPGRPTSGSWRLRVGVEAQLSGSEETARHFQLYPSLLERRFRDGNTNISVNPFSTKMKFVKSLGQVVSQEISEE